MDIYYIIECQAITTRTDRIARDPTRPVERVLIQIPTFDNKKDNGSIPVPLSFFHSSWQELHQVSQSNLFSSPLLILNRDNNQDCDSQRQCEAQR